MSYVYNFQMHNIYKGIVCSTKILASFVIIVTQQLFQFYLQFLPLSIIKNKLPWILTESEEGLPKRIIKFKVSFNEIKNHFEFITFSHPLNFIRKLFFYKNKIQLYSRITHEILFFSFLLQNVFLNFSELAKHIIYIFCYSNFSLMMVHD